MTTTDTITWHGPAETWTWPPTEEQRARLATCPACADGIIQIVGIGPDRPDLILAVGYEARDTDAYCDIGEPMVVRFGQMPLAVYVDLPEHGGW